MVVSMTVCLEHVVTGHCGGCNHETSRLVFKENICRSQLHCEIESMHSQMLLLNESQTHLDVHVHKRRAYLDSTQIHVHMYLVLSSFTSTYMYNPKRTTLHAHASVVSDNGRVRVGAAVSLSTNRWNAFVASR